MFCIYRTVRLKQDTDGQKYVEVKKFGGGEEIINIEIGIRADTGTEIISGLKDGQEVIVSKK